MELPKYAVPESLLSSQTVSPSRGDYTLQEPTEKSDGVDRNGKVTGKRKRMDVRSTSLKSVLESIGPPQYTVPEYLLSPQISYSSPGNIMFQAPLNETVGSDHHENFFMNSHPESNMTMHSRTEPVYLAKDAHRETHGQPSLPISTHTKRSEDLSCTVNQARQSLDKSPSLTFQKTTRDLSINDCSLGMPQDASFPTPTMTDPWAEASTPSLSWNSGPGLPFLLDEDMALAEPDVAIAEAAPERYEPTSDKRVSDTHSPIDTIMSGPKDDSQLDTFMLTEARISHVLKAVAAVGFDSLDDAIIAYYVNSSKGDERLRQAQRLSRIRRLPILLKELHLAAQGWGEWQRRSFQEQIIKSTEDIVISELENYLAVRRHDHHNSACSTEHPCQACKSKERDETYVEAELPNTWTLLTSLSTRCSAIASKDGQPDVPRLISKLLTAVTNLGT